MNNPPKISNRQPNIRLDITNDICPMTFVRTKLQLERMTSGDVLEVRLKGEEPLKNVPRSAVDQGDEVLGLTLETDGDGPDGIHLLLIRKA